MLFTGDRVRQLHTQLGLPDPDKAGYKFLTAKGYQGHEMTVESWEGQMLRQIEDHLSIWHPAGEPLGTRLKNAEAKANAATVPFNHHRGAPAQTATASPTSWRDEMQFAKGDRVRYTGKAPGWCDKNKIGATGTVDAQTCKTNVRVLWDDPKHKKNGGVFPENLELVVAAGNPYPPGTRVEVHHSLAPQYNGRVGSVVRSVGDRGFDVKIDGDTVPCRYFSTASLKLETPKMTTIVNRVTAAISGFFGTPVPSTANQAARELAAATKLASIAESKKKRAKGVLTSLGVLLPEYRPGTVKIFEDSEFRIEAQTKEPGQRLDEARLRSGMRAAGLSAAKCDLLFLDARVDNKAATSVVVTEL